MNRLAFFLIVGGSVAACGEKTKVLTADEVARAVRTRLHSSGLITGLPTCPSAAATKGTTVECTVQVETTTYPFTAKIADVVDGKAQFEIAWKNGGNGVVLRQLAVPPVREEVWKEYGTNADVVCRDALMLLDDKHSVTCDFSPNLIDTKLTITFDDKGTRTGWTTTPILLARKSMQAAVMTEIKATHGPTAEIACGKMPVEQESVIVRPESGKVACSLTVNEKGTPKAYVAEISVGADRKVTGWEVIREVLPSDR